VMPAPRPCPCGGRRHPRPRGPDRRADHALLRAVEGLQPRRGRRGRAELVGRAGPGGQPARPQEPARRRRSIAKARTRRSRRPASTWPRRPATCARPTATSARCAGSARTSTCPTTTDNPFTHVLLRRVREHIQGRDPGDSGGLARPGLPRRPVPAHRRGRLPVRVADVQRRLPHGADRGHAAPGLAATASGQNPTATRFTTGAAGHAHDLLLSVSRAGEDAYVAGGDTAECLRKVARTSGSAQPRTATFRRHSAVSPPAT